MSSDRRNLKPRSSRMSLEKRNLMHRKRNELERQKNELREKELAAQAEQRAADAEQRELRKAELIMQERLEREKWNSRNVWRVKN